MSRSESLTRTVPYASFDVLAFSDALAFVRSIHVLNASPQTVSLYIDASSPNGVPIEVAPNVTVSIPVRPSKEVAVAYSGSGSGVVYINYSDSETVATTSGVTPAATFNVTVDSTNPITVQISPTSLSTVAVSSLPSPYTVAVSSLPAIDIASGQSVAVSSLPDVVLTVQPALEYAPAVSSMNGSVGFYVGMGVGAASNLHVITGTLSPAVTSFTTTISNGIVRSDLYCVDVETYDIKHPNGLIIIEFQNYVAAQGLWTLYGAAMVAARSGTTQFNCPIPPSATSNEPARVVVSWNPSSTPPIAPIDVRVGVNGYQ